MTERDLTSGSFEERRRARGDLRVRLRSAYSHLDVVLWDTDLMGLACIAGVPRDEYDNEVGTILPRLAACRTVDEVRAVVHEEFSRWFGGCRHDEAACTRDAERIVAEVLPLLSGGQDAEPAATGT